MLTTNTEKATPEMFDLFNLNFDCSIIRRIRALNLRGGFIRTEPPDHNAIWEGREANQAAMVKRANRRCKSHPPKVIRTLSPGSNGAELWS